MMNGKREEWRVKRGRIFSSSLFTFHFSFLICFTFLFFNACLHKSPAQGFLEIRSTASGRVYGEWPLSEAGEFSIEFIHSVNQSPVRESFVVENGMIKLLALRFYSFGAGIPSTLEEDQELSRDGDAMLITGYKASFNELSYIVGTVSDHLLIINEETISLTELAGVNPGEGTAHISISLK